MLVSWLVAAAPLLAAGDAFSFAAVALSYAGQWMKGQKRIPTIAVQGVLLGIGFAFYWLSHPFSGADGWLRDGLMWSSGLPGIASMSAGVGIAPKTDSRT